MRNSIYVKMVAAFMSILLVGAVTAGCKRPASVAANTATTAAGTVKSSAASSPQTNGATGVTENTSTPDPANATESPVSLGYDATPTPDASIQTDPPENTVQPTKTRTPYPSINRTPAKTPPPPDSNGYTLYFAEGYDVTGVAYKINTEFPAGSFYIFFDTPAPVGVSTLKIVFYRQTGASETVSQTVNVSTWSGDRGFYKEVSLGATGDYRVAIYRNETELLASANVKIK